MVLTREIIEKIESAVNIAVNKSLKSDSFVNTIANDISAAVIKTVIKKLSQLEADVEILQGDLSKMRKEFDSKINKIQHIVQKTNNEKCVLEKKFEQMDQATRRMNLRIFNYKEKANEHVREELIQIFNAKMATNVSTKDIEICYRVGQKNESKPRCIFMKLNSYETKHAIYSKKKMLKGTGIVIREDLTSQRVALLSKCAEKVGFKNVWTESGKIHVNVNNKIHILKSEEDFEKVFAE
ncbi:unnamed protein product [Phaedon cochleariae]|uniref:Zinc finger DNA binding protein n=1 Tax=Phaedon cochleariae TaxID=80249 RepID=A0A9P0DQ13_PHACE|nr:unnamed protein product [Phaedon cochleariae]